MILKVFCKIMVMKWFLSAHSVIRSIYKIVDMKCFSSTAFMKQTACNLTPVHCNKCAFENNFDENIYNVAHDWELGFGVMQFIEPNEFIYCADYMKNYLYPNSEDLVVNQLKNCSSINEVLNIVSECNEMNISQICQSVLTVRTIKFCENNLTEQFVDTNSLSSNNSFKKLLNLIDKNCPSMNLFELTSCLLCLNKLCVPLTDELMRKLAELSELQINGYHEADVPLETLIKFCSVFRSHTNLWSIYTLKNIFPIVINRLGNCNSIRELYFITLCLIKLSLLVNNSLLDLYIKKMDYFLQNNNDDEIELRKIKVKTAIRALIFLDNNVFYGMNINSIRKLTCYLQGNLDLLTVKELYTLYKKIQVLQEPMNLIKELNQISLNWYSRLNQSSLYSLMSTIMFSEKNFDNHRLDLDRSLRNNMDQLYLKNTANLTLFSDLIRNDAFWSNELVFPYWIKMIELMKWNLKSQNYEAVIQLCNRYVSFIYHQRFFQCYAFEKIIVDSLLKCVHDENVYTRPYVFSKILSYLLVFIPVNILQTENILELINKLENDILRLNSSDSRMISINLYYALSLRKIRKTAKPVFLQYYVKLTTALYENNKRFLSLHSDISSYSLNDLFYNHWYRQTPVNCDTFQEIINRLNRLKPKDINSKIIKQILKVLSNFQYMAPTFVDCCIEYCFQNKDLIHVNTAGIILNYCFNFGYCSKYHQRLIDITIELLSRDLDVVNHHSMLRCALSLCYFDRLPLNLVNYIFNIDYITEIERLISSGYKTMKIDSLIKSTLMKVNRAVCLDYPEYNIPWFHDYYQPPTYQPWNIQHEIFYKEVREILVQIIKKENHLVANHISPYNYAIDFFFCLNSDRISVHPFVALNDPTITKIAVLLKNISPQEYYFRKGKHEMKCRHLEILNYRVIQINFKEWNSMFMSDPLVRLSYVKDRIFCGN